MTNQLDVLRKRFLVNIRNPKHGETHGDWWTPIAMLFFIFSFPCPTNDY